MIGFNKRVAYLCGEFRRELGITQREIADELGTFQTNISAFERGLNDSGTILQWYYDHGFYYYLIEYGAEMKSVKEESNDAESV